MPELILATIFGIFFALFATQNSGSAVINLFNLGLYQFPLYMIVLSSLLVGLLISWLFNLVDWAGSSFKLHTKNSELHHINSEAETLRRKIHELERENSELRLRNKDVNFVERPQIAFERKSPFQRLMYSITH